MRIDLYTGIHKAQRYHMFRLANEIGRADISDERAVADVLARVRRMVDHLRDHAQNEETYIHPLFDALGSDADHLRHEHHDLERDLEGLERVLGERSLQDLYAAYTRVLGRYLLHLSEEEDAQKQILWKHYDDEALRAVLDRFKAERARDKATADLEFMLSAMSMPELVKLFRSLTQAA